MILPIAVYFGVMGLFNVPLNIGTAMVAAIAIGISVDDTIHFMTRYNAEMHHLKSQEEAMRSLRPYRNPTRYFYFNRTDPRFLSADPIQFRLYYPFRDPFRRCHGGSPSL